MMRSRSHSPSFAVGLLFLFAAQASAASFDCGKASRPHERIICAVPDLSAADAELAAAYQQASGALPEAVRALLRTGQREWLTWLPATCSDDGKGQVFKKRSEAAECLLRGYKDRIAVLRKTPSIDSGFEIMPIQRFRVVPADRSAGGFRPIAVHTTERPLILGPAGPATDLLNAEAERATGPAPGAERDSDSAIHVSLSGPHSEIATLTISTEFYGHGAAHPVNGVLFRNFRLDRPAPLAFEDVFAAPSASKALAPLVLADLKDQLKDDLMTDDLAEIEKMVAEVDRWSFEGSGLTVNFNVYEVAAYALGPQSVALPWKTLEPMLSPFARSVLAGR
jgi:uncharacterized protein